MFFGFIWVDFGTVGSKGQKTVKKPIDKCRIRWYNGIKEVQVLL